MKFASINIERSNHLHRVEAFLKTHQPEVLCLQELCERDIPYFEQLMGGKLQYCPMTRHPAEAEMETIGIGIVSRHALEDVTEEYYVGQRHPVPEIRFIYATGTNGQQQKSADHSSINSALLSATVNGFRIATTHLTVTVGGLSTLQHLTDAWAVIGLARQQAQSHGGLVLCGDFNAPRGRATFSLLAESFTDNIPPHYTTSLDGTLHRAGHLPYMVDGLFTTPEYKASEVALHTGVSDHCALTATLAKAG